jgi:hypothetical protein
VQFTPTSAGPVTPQSLVITSNGRKSPMRTIEVLGTGR